MTKKDALKYWEEGAVDAFDTAEKLFTSRKYNHSLFFLQLALEKIIKAIFVNNKDEAAPIGHDLVRLARKSEISVTNKEESELAEISTFNIAGRYDDYKFKFYQKANREFSDKWIKTGKRLYNKFSSLLK